MFEVKHGECLDVLRGMADGSVDSVVTDPPYELGFMGKKWDSTGIANNVEMWAEVLRVLKPGGYLVSFSGTRTYHRMTCAIEDAGFEVRDQLAWVYGSGFPKSHDISKAIDKLKGAERERVKPRSVIAHQRNIGNTRPYMSDPDHTTVSDVPATAAAEWQGWGTALKPAWEPICLARKPFAGTVAGNVLRHGTGAINVDACRVGTDGGGTHCSNRDGAGRCMGHRNAGQSTSGETFHGPDSAGGRWPANLCHDGSEEVLALFPDSKGQQGALRGTEPSRTGDENTVCYGKYGPRPAMPVRGDSGSAARFFYCAKATKADREEGNDHPTVKPTDLMRWLCRLVTPPGGTVLDLFLGSGSTGKAAAAEGFRFIGVEREEQYVAIARDRIRRAYDQHLGLDFV